MMHFCVFAVMDAFYHFGTNEGTTCDYAVEGNHFSEMLRPKGAGVDVMVTKRPFEADVEHYVVIDVGVLGTAKSHCSFFQGAIEWREEFGWFGKDTVRQSNLGVACSPMT